MAADGASSHGVDRLADTARLVRDAQRILDASGDASEKVSRLEALLTRAMAAAAGRAHEPGPRAEDVQRIMVSGRGRLAMAAEIEPLLQRVRGRSYVGSERFCPVCASSIRQFLPFDIAGGRSAAFSGRAVGPCCPSPSRDRSRARTSR